jgi:hypothetical protein
MSSEKEGSKDSIKKRLYNNYIKGLYKKRIQSFNIFIKIKKAPKSQFK